MSALGLSHLHKYHPSKTFSWAAIEPCIAKMLPSLLGLHGPVVRYLFKNLIITSYFLTPNTISQLDYTIHSQFGL